MRSVKTYPRDKPWITPDIKSSENQKIRKQKSELYLKNTQSFQHLLISKRGVHQSHYHKINP